MFQCFRVILLLIIHITCQVLSIQIGEFDLGLFSSLYSSNELQQQLSIIIDDSFKSFGMVKLTNSSLFSINGTYRSITNELYNKSVEFFTEYSLSDKKKYIYGPPGTPGYLPPNSEGPSNLKRNLKESFVFYSVPNNKERIEPFEEPPILWNAMKSFWFRFDEEIIDHFHNAVKLCFNISDGEINININNIFDHKHLLIPYYYETIINSDDLEIELRHQPHRDGFGFTFLWIDNHCGLQIFYNETNEWIDIEADENAIFVLSGQLIPYYTNNRWKDLLHRVVKCKNNNNDNNIIESRIAFVMFTGPDFDKIIFPWNSNETVQDGLSVKQHLKHYWTNIDQLTSNKTNKNEL